MSTPVPDSSHIGPPTKTPPPHTGSETAIEARHIKQVGPYEIVRKIGQGGMGAVFEAYDSRLRRKIALKVISTGGLDAEDVARFIREAEHTAKLRHPNCIQIHDMGRADGFDYFTMDLIDGRMLDDWVKEKPRTPREIATIIEKSARALHHAHEHGVIHRDIKPSNIMVDRSDNPIVMDFGLARSSQQSTKLTLTGTTMGTPAFMSPEQAQGFQDMIGPRSDVWSLGVVLYEMLTGKMPFEHPELVQLVIRIMTHDPVPLRRLNHQLPAEIEVIVLKCLEKDPQRRYGSMKELAEDLKAWLEFMPISATPPSTMVVIARNIKRRPAPYLAALAGILGLFALAIFWGLQQSRSSFAKLSEMHSKTLSKSVSTELHNVMDPAEPILSEMVQWGRLKLVDVNDPDKLGPLLVERLRVHPDFAWLSYSNGENGRFIGARREKGAVMLKRSDPSDDPQLTKEEEYRPDGKHILLPLDPKRYGYDPRIRPFFKLVQASDGMIWTDPYKFYEGIPGITAARGFREGTPPQLKGVFTVDFGLEHMVALLDSLEKEYHCKMYLVNARGMNVLKLEGTDETLTACWEKVQKNLDSQGEGKAELEVSGKEVLAYKNRFELPGKLEWYLLTVFER